MKEKYNIDDMENFLSNSLNADEQSAFEKDMAADKTFAEEVAFHDDIIKGIQTAGAADFRNMVKGVHSEMKEEGFFLEKETTEKETTIVQKEATVRSISMFRKLAIAASFALVLAAGFWVFSPKPLPADQLFASHFSTHPDVLTIEVEDRLSETGFGTNKEALLLLQNAIVDYNSGNHIEAINQFDGFQRMAPSDALTDYADFYQALSYVETDRLDKAISALTSLEKKDNFTLQKEAKWYLALTYLKQGNKLLAKPLLEALSREQIFKSKATTILKQL